MKARYLYLYGKLGKILGKKHKIYVSSITEAMKYLAANFGEKFYSNMKEGYYKIKKVTGDNISYIGEDGLFYNLGEGDLYLIPVAKGASQRGKQVGMIVGAVVLAAATLATGGALAAGWAGVGAAFTSSAGAATAVSTLGWAGTALMYTAASMALQGIAGLLTPLPKTGKNKEVDRNEGSSTAIRNNGAEGSTIPVIYGQVKVGSIVVSSQVTADRAATTEQYKTCISYLDTFVKRITDLIDAYQTAINTTAESTETIELTAKNYPYYPGRYPNIKSVLTPLRTSCISYRSRAKTLRDQEITAFSLDACNQLLDEVITFCTTSKPTLESLYSVVGETNDFEVINAPYIMEKQAKYRKKTVVYARSYASGHPRIRRIPIKDDDPMYVDASKCGYDMYLAVEKGTTTARAINTLTPLDLCYFLNNVIKNTAETLRVT